MIFQNNFLLKRDSADICSYYSCRYSFLDTWRLSFLMINLKMSPFLECVPTINWFTLSRERVPEFRNTLLKIYPFKSKIFQEKKCFCYIPEHQLYGLKCLKHSDVCKTRLSAFSCYITVQIYRQIQVSCSFPSRQRVVDVLSVKTLPSVNECQEQLHRKVFYRFPCKNISNLLTYFWLFRITEEFLIILYLQMTDNRTY